MVASSSMRKITKDKRGVMGLSTAQAFVVGLLSLVIIGVLTIIVLNSLNSAGVLPASSIAANATNDIISNTSAGLVTFFTNTGTWLTLLSVVVIILIIAAVIVVVNKFSGPGGEGSL